MAIENINNRLQNNTVTKPPTSNKQSGNASIGKQSDADSVEITTVAQELKSALASMSSTPIINTERVEAVRTVLANGNYRIDAESIAEKMIQMERSLPDEGS